MNTCIYTYIYIYICIYVIYIYIHTRNYALAIASAEFPPQSIKDSMDIPLGSKVWNSRMTVWYQNILLSNRSGQPFYHVFQSSTFSVLWKV